MLVNGLILKVLHALCFNNIYVQNDRIAVLIVLFEMFGSFLLLSLTQILGFMG